MEQSFKRIRKKQSGVVTRPKQGWQGFSDAQKNLNCHGINMLQFGGSYDDRRSDSAKYCSLGVSDCSWAGCQELSCLWLEIHTLTNSLSWSAHSQLPDFCRAACWVCPRAVCNSDFSETRIPIVWMWTFGKGKSAQHKTSLLVTATPLLSQKDNSGKVKSSCS